MDMWSLNCLRRPARGDVKWASRNRSLDSGDLVDRPVLAVLKTGGWGVGRDEKKCRLNPEAVLTLETRGTAGEAMETELQPERWATGTRPDRKIHLQNAAPELLSG